MSPYAVVFGLSISAFYLLSPTGVVFHRTVMMDASRLSSTIDGNVEFVHSLVQLYSYVTSVNSFMCPTKLKTIVIIKCLSYNEISAFLCNYFLFLHFFI